MKKPRIACGTPLPDEAPPGAERALEAIIRGWAHRTTKWSPTYPGQRSASEPAITREEEVILETLDRVREDLFDTILNCVGDLVSEKVRERTVTREVVQHEVHKVEAACLHPHVDEKGVGPLGVWVQPTSESVVYYIERERDGAIKIGFTASLGARVKAIAREQGCPVRVLASESGGWQLEQTRHREFRKDHLEGEWFLPTARLVGYVRSLW